MLASMLGSVCVFACSGSLEKLYLYVILSLNRGKRRFIMTCYFVSGTLKTPCPLHGCKRVYSDRSALDAHIKDHDCPAQSLPGQSFSEAAESDSASRCPCCVNEISRTGTCVMNYSSYFAIYLGLYLSSKKKQIGNYHKAGLREENIYIFLRD